MDGRDDDDVTFLTQYYDQLTNKPIYPRSYTLGVRIPDSADFQRFLASTQELAFRETSWRFDQTVAETQAELERREFSTWPKPPNRLQRALIEARRRLSNAWAALHGAYLDGE